MPNKSVAKTKKNKSSNKLNKQQQVAVDHGVTGKGANIAGPLLVIAGAGTGKTNTLAHRIANLIDKGGDPRRILVLTFTRQAANEMKSRIKRTMAVASKGSTIQASGSVLWCGTFHSIGLRLLRSHAKQLSLQPSFTVHDRDDSVELMASARQELGYAHKAPNFPGKAACLAIYSRVVNGLQPLEQVMTDHFPTMVVYTRKLAKVIDAYVAAKQAQQVLDFDDLLVYWDELLKDNRLARAIGGRFDHVLVDEFQDTNALQASILRRMKPDGAGLTVVGDDAQSIYGFRAAEVRNILDFPNQFDPPATIVKLETNYRSTAPILEASNAVINLATEGYDKKLKATRNGGSKPRLVTGADETAQAQLVAEEIKTSFEQGQPFKRHAVLFRASFHSLMLELELARNGIPFKKFGGATFTEAAHIKDVLGVLKWAENPTDKVTGLRVLSLLPGIGPAKAMMVFDEMAAGKLPKGHVPADVPERAADGWTGLSKLLRRLRADKIDWPGQVGATRQWYQPYLESSHEDHEDRSIDLDQLDAMASTFKSRRQFLADMTLDAPTKRKNAGTASKDDDNDFVTLSTIHSCKGKEWRTVFVLNVVDGSIPSSRAENDKEIEEERRLLYVAMTRAKQELTLTLPWRLTVRGRASSGDNAALNKRSRFIPDDLLQHFERCTWRSDEGSDDDAGGSTSTRIDLAARVRRRWSQ